MTRPSTTVEIATQCADGEQIASTGGKPYPLDQADKHCPCGGPHWIGQRTVTYGPWETVPAENGPSSVDDSSTPVQTPGPADRDGSVPPPDDRDYTAFDYDLDERCEP